MVAYSPMGRGERTLLKNPEIGKIAEETGRTPAQVVLGPFEHATIHVWLLETLYILVPTRPSYRLLVSVWAHIYIGKHARLRCGVFELDEMCCASHPRS